MLKYKMPVACSECSKMLKYKTPVPFSKTPAKATVQNAHSVFKTGKVQSPVALPPTANRTVAFNANAIREMLISGEQTQVRYVCVNMVPRIIVQ